LSDGVVTLGPWSPGDIDWVHETCQDPEIQAWTLVPAPYGREHAQEFVNVIAPESFSARIGTHLCICDAASSRRLGAVGLEISDPACAVGEVGYWLRAAERGRGFASRAVGLLGDWALGAMGLERLELHILDGNEASKRVALRCGYELEGLLHSREQRGSIHHDVALFARLRS
jgi:RimJ/RimL family protein N-acetyltransferase